MLNSGIYKIVNLVNGKLYVGSSNNLKNRRWKHFHSLKKNSHENRHLQKSHNKYGENNFKFDVIEYVEDKNELLNREQFWIDELDVCNPEIGYNICLKAGSTLGRIMPLEARVKISNSKIGVKRSLEHNINSSKALTGLKRSSEVCIRNGLTHQKSVINLSTGEIFKSLKTAGEHYNIRSNSISEVCRGKRKTAGGYKWSYI